MAKVVLVAAVQLNPDLDSPTGTVDRVIAAIGEAAAQGAELVVFPEDVGGDTPAADEQAPPAPVSNGNGNGNGARQNVAV